MDRDATSEALPRPTHWPMFLALAIVSCAFGIIFSWWFVVAGASMFVVGLAGWIGDLRAEHGRDDGGERDG